MLIYPNTQLINKILSNFTKIANNKNGTIVLKKIIILTKNNIDFKYILLEYVLNSFTEIYN